MTEFEIALAQAYLSAARQDPVAALIRSVRDLARIRSLVSNGYVRGVLPGPSMAGHAEDGPGGAVGNEG